MHIATCLEVVQMCVIHHLHDLRLFNGPAEVGHPEIYCPDVSLVSQFGLPFKFIQIPMVSFI